MRRKPWVSKSHPLPRFEYMSRNRRAVFGDPPSAYLAAVIERNERARQKREQARLENEQSQVEEELPRKRPGPNNNQVNTFHTRTDCDDILWSGSATPASNTHPASGTSHSQIFDSESNWESHEQSDNTSTDQTNDEGHYIEEYENEGTEYSQEDAEYEGPEGVADGAEGFQDSDDGDNDAEMADDDKINIQGQDWRSSEITVLDKEQEGVDDHQNGRTGKPGDRNDILVNKEICAPSPVRVNWGSTTANLLVFTSNNAIITPNEHAEHPSATISHRSFSHAFPVPDNDALEIENLAPVEVNSQDLNSRLVGNRHIPVSLSEDVFHTGSSRTVMLPTLIASASQSAFTTDQNFSNQDEPFCEENDNGAVHYTDEFSSELGYQNLDW
ncbi:hypothetical protein AJ78_03500 [Emergomyces pasteurianus Ep9510]|uniref:Uncharacterized protein n=1 Tax=Emergomyces pasteurianus Ep9510 TaxID=1447872 RepID=A0A1J9Q7W8_9EURO|nr:hypothetical protein AJ78_03500 [Emergomyces pasteurianus Ep9510]